MARRLTGVTPRCEQLVVEIIAAVISPRAYHLKYLLLIRGGPRFQGVKKIPALTLCSDNTARYRNGIIPFTKGMRYVGLTERCLRKQTDAEPGGHMAPALGKLMANSIGR